MKQVNSCGSDAPSSDVVADGDAAPDEITARLNRLEITQEDSESETGTGTASETADVCSEAIQQQCDGCKEDADGRVCCGSSESLDGAGNSDGILDGDTSDDDVHHIKDTFYTNHNKDEDKVAEAEETEMSVISDGVSMLTLGTSDSSTNVTNNQDHCDNKDDVAEAEENELSFFSEGVSGLTLETSATGTNVTNDQSSGDGGGTVDSATKLSNGMTDDDANAEEQCSDEDAGKEKKINCVSAMSAERHSVADDNGTMPLTSYPHDDDEDATTDDDIDTSSLPADISSSLNTESVLSLPLDNTDSSISIRDEETNNHQLMLDSDVTDAERREAMLAAMDVFSVGKFGQHGPGLALSVEACLARFTDKELLSGANMITCEACSHAAAAGTNSNYTGNKQATSGGDHSSSKTTSNGKYALVILSM